MAGCASSPTADTQAAVRTVMEFHQRIARSDLAGAVRMLRSPLPGIDIEWVAVAVEFHREFSWLSDETRDRFDREPDIGYVGKRDVEMGLAIAADGALSKLYNEWAAPPDVAYLPATPASGHEVRVHVVAARTGAVLQEWTLVRERAGGRLRWPGIPAEVEHDPYPPDPDEFGAAAERLRGLTRTLRELNRALAAGEISTFAAIEQRWNAALAAADPRDQ